MNNEELRKQAWDFFQMQSGQRLTTFNYYVFICSVACTGLASSFRADSSNPYIGISFGLLLVLFSFIFLKIDHRNRDLIKGAEEALKFFERTSTIQDADDGPHIAKRFLREDFDTCNKKQAKSWKLWLNTYSYSECFRLVFTIFAVVGFSGASWSFFRLIGLCQ